MRLTITLSGVDCAGKSTQIFFLKSYFSAKGERPHVIWYRPGYSKELDLIRKVGRFFSSSMLPGRREGTEREKMFSRLGISCLWILMALCDILFQWILKIRLHMNLGKVIICDRYIWDALTDLELRFPHMGRVTRVLTHRVLSLCPKPDVALLIVISKQELRRRIADKKEPFPDSAWIRSLRYERYMQLAGEGVFVVVDGERPPEVVHEELVRQIRKKLGQQ